MAGKRKVEFYKNDLVIGRYRTLSDMFPKDSIAHSAGKRGEVKRLSKASRKRLMFVIANTEVTFVNMITLTYPKNYPTNQVSKKHLNTFLTAIRRKGVLDYLWVLEFQKRGAPHYHVWTSGYLDYLWVAERWYSIVGSLDPRHLSAGTRVEKLRKKGAFYALKYAAKGYQKECPDDVLWVGRLWGHSRSVKPSSKHTTYLTNEQIMSILGDNGRSIDAMNRGCKVLYGASPVNPKD